MNERPLIAILMATYNGTAYLPELLDSLCRQTFADWHLFVLDDLSTDGTLQLLRNFAAGEARVTVLSNDRKRGAMMGFMELLQRVEARYYMFCDQDDVWLPQKVERTLRKMQETECLHPGLPVMVHTDLKVVDARLEEIAPSFWRMSRIRPDLLHTFNEAAGHFLATGCTMMINGEARMVSLPVRPEALMHDCWVTDRVLQCSGIVAEVDEATMLYRQHGKNTIGARDLQNNYILNKMRVLGNVLKENRRHYRMLSGMGYGNIFKFLYYKFRYFVLYKK